MQEPEVGRGPFVVEAADPADHGVGGEEGEIIEADDGGVDHFGRDFGEEDEADRKHVSEGDAVEKWNATGQKRPIFRPAPCVAAAVNRHMAPPMEKADPMMILVISSGSRQRLLYQR